MKKISRPYLASVLCGLCSLASMPALALDPEIRMYKLDKKQGFTKAHNLLGKGDNPGCHNTLFKYAVYKVTVIKFKSCSVYSEKDCKPESVIPAYWKNKGDPKTEMTRGANWHLDRNDDNVDVASWSCK
jgi:hypothetical protein